MYTNAYYVGFGSVRSSKLNDKEGSGLWTGSSICWNSFKKNIKKKL